MGILGLRIERWIKILLCLYLVEINWRTLYLLCEETLAIFFLCREISYIVRDFVIKITLIFFRLLFLRIEIRTVSRWFWDTLRSRSVISPTPHPSAPRKTTDLLVGGCDCSIAHSDNSEVPQGYFTFYREIKNKTDPYIVQQSCTFQRRWKINISTGLWFWQHRRVKMFFYAGPLIGQRFSKNVWN